MRNLFKLQLFKTFRRTMGIFTQKINPITGKNDWELQDENYDYHQEIARSAFADMLHDEERNKKYFLGLKSAINKMHSLGKPAHVLDIGTGTGLLSMMAVQCGADSVTACEAFKPIADCAKKIIAKNGSKDKIVVIEKRSTNLSVGPDGDLKQKANILVTEVFDTELIGEGALGTFTHAHKYLLDADCIVVPKSATIYVQVVESRLINNWNNLNMFRNIEGIKLPPNMLKCKGAAAVHDLQLTQIPIDSVKFLSDPIPILNFDWSGKSELPFESSNKKIIRIKEDGSTQAVFMWWDLIMDPNEEILLSCAPFWTHPDLRNVNREEVSPESIPWRDHWMQAIYYFTPQENLQKGQDMNLFGNHDEYSLWFDLKPLNIIENSIKPTCDCCLHVACSRTRLGQINDDKRVDIYKKVLENCINTESVCLFLGDSNFLSLIAVALGAKRVYCLESHYMCRYVLNALVEHNRLKDKIFLLKSEEELYNLQNLNSINLIFSEPFFMMSILPWDNLHSLFILKQLQTMMPFDKVEIYPKKAVIKGIAVQFLDLHKIKTPLENCEGFDMEYFDNLIKNASELSDANVEPHPLWEYPNIALSQVFQIAEFDCTIGLPEQIVENSNSVALEGDGSCNGIALWVDWDMDGTKSNIISTGPDATSIKVGEKIPRWDMHTKQGVYFFPKVNSSEEKAIHFMYRYDNEIISFGFNFC